ncbi:MAG: hypothetical protein K9K88_02615, partial [Desulfobacterales bacterium]|nr:hypothetical protein [Desulfobacterales bacterium]
DGHASAHGMNIQGNEVRVQLYLSKITKKLQCAQKAHKFATIRGYTLTQSAYANQEQSQPVSAYPVISNRQKRTTSGKDGAQEEEKEPAHTDRSFLYSKI